VYSRESFFNCDFFEATSVASDAGLLAASQGHARWSAKWRRPLHVRKWQVAMTAYSQPAVCNGTDLLGSNVMSTASKGDAD